MGISWAFLLTELERLYMEPEEARKASKGLA